MKWVLVLKNKVCVGSHQKEIQSKWLKRYASLVSNAANGAVLKSEL